MKMFWEKQISRILPLGLILMTLSGCVSYPIAKNLQKQAQPLALSQVVEDPDANQGKLVIWGGKIIKTANDVNNSAIYVLALPLDDSGEPVLYANSAGRFIASSKGFLDPEIYKNGRLITVAGTVAGLETEAVQKANYTYPVLNIKQIHLWPAERRYYYYHPDGYWYGYYPDWWYWGWYPGWSWGWGWYYRGDWDGDGGYHYHGGSWDGDHDGGHWGGAYHYQGGNQGGGGHWHR